MTAEDKESGSLTTGKNSFENELKDHDQRAQTKASSDKVEEGPPSRHLWVGNVGSSVTKAQLSEQFARFGDLENVAEYPSRNYAFVNFKNKEDAVYAKRGLQGSVFGGLAIRIEYAKGNIKGEGHHRADADETLEDQEESEVGSAKASERHKRERDRDEPSETLWVGFPLCMKVDERKLHKAFSPFGAVQRITTFPGRTYAFVEFHSVKAASRAKNVLQGKLFNDPRVSISFAKSEIGPVEQQRVAESILSPPPPPVHDMPILLPKHGSFVNPRNDRYLNLDASRANNSNIRRQLEGGITESKVFLSSHYGSGYEDGISRDTRQELETWQSSALSGGLMQRRHTSPSIDERWNMYDEATGRRDPKRPRSGANQAAVRGSLDLGMDRQTFLSLKSQEYPSRLSSLESWGDHESSKRYLQGGKQSAGYNMDPLTSDWIQRSQSVDRGLKESLHWQGVIAKSGTTVCHARCYNVGNASCKVPFPDSVNCTARTSLDMLAKHIKEVGEFSLVTFEPLAELDVEPYQDFIAYLSEKNRAAVCKLSLECTLFLVPPSEFAELFLKVDRGNSIIGVVLKLQQAFGSTVEQPVATILQPLKAEIPSSSLLPELKYQNTAHDLQQPVKTSMSVPFHPLEGILSHSLIQSSKPVTSMFSSATVTPSTSGLNGGAAGPSSIGLVSAPDEKWLSHSSAGYGSINQDQHSNARSRGGFSFSQSGELSLPEMSMQTPSISVLPAPAQYTPGNHQLKDLNQNLQAPSGPTAYHHQPPLPQYPHPSAQQKLVSSQPSQILPSFQSDQLSQLLSIVAQQAQPPQENSSQAIMQPQHPANTSLKTPMLPNFSHVVSASPTQVFHPQIAQNNVNAIDAEQRDLLQLAQQKLSETRVDNSGEDSKRFQATLELAAALLQQLQQKSKS